MKLIGYLARLSRILTLKQYSCSFVWPDDAAIVFHLRKVFLTP